MAKPGINLTEYNPDQGDKGLPVHIADGNVATGQLNALNAQVVLALNGYPGASAVIQAGTLVGTLAYEQTYDNGITWSIMVVSAGGTQGAFTTFAAPNAETVPQFFLGSNATHVRVRVTAFTSGSALCIVRANRIMSAFSVGGLPVSQNSVAAALFISTEGGRATVGGFPAAVATGQAQYALFDTYGRLTTKKLDTWTALNAPAAAAQATVTKASAGAGIKNVCTSITCTLSSAAAPTVAIVLFELLDNATQVWIAKASLPGTAGAALSIVCDDLWIEGTAATAMTLRTNAATAANVVATVSMTGTITQ